MRSLDAANRQVGARRVPSRGLFGAMVLPRVLRRPARALVRLARQMPPRLGLLAFFAMFAATAVAGTLIGGHAYTVVSAATAWAGLAIDKVVITGQSETSEVDVLDRLALGDYPSLLTLDVDAARARIEALPWVEHATITKLYPDTVTVAISEREPYALWQHDGRMSLVDRAGAVIVDGVGERYAKLPLVAGPGAGERAAEFANLIGAFPNIAWRARAGAWVSGRRWTVVLDNDMALLLPPDNPAAALQWISRMDAAGALLSREVAAVDLRMPDRVILRLTEAGVAARTALLNERAATTRTRTNG